MRMLTETKSDTDLLLEVPAFSSCSRVVVDAYVAQGLATVDLAERGTLNLAAHPAADLFVVRSGLALLKTGDGVVVTLEAGDFFGSGQLHGHGLAAKVVAVSDAEFVRVSADDLAHLKRASSRERHPSNIEWQSELRTTVRRKVRLDHRRAVLVRQSA
jgi:hypothetical protein